MSFADKALVDIARREAWLERRQADALKQIGQPSGVPVRKLSAAEVNRSVDGLLQKAQERQERLARKRELALRCG